MNRKVKIILIIAAVMVPVGALIMMLGIKFGGGAGWGLDVNGGQAKVITGTLDESVDLKEFDSLEVEIASADVIIMRGDSYKIEYKTREGKEPVIEEDGGKLTVKQPPTGLVLFDFSFGSENNTYIIYIPDNGKETELQVRASSGDIMLDRVKVSGSVKASSGDVLLNDIEGGELTVNTSSGEINADKVRSSKVDFMATSGDINMLRVDTDEIGGKTSSGDININDSVADVVNLKATSGEVVVALGGAPDDYSYDLNVTSGDITVNGVEAEGREYVKENSGNRSLTVETTSGDIDIMIE